jgi:AcrR family transcriptional regulator
VTVQSADPPRRGTQVTGATEHSELIQVSPYERAPQFDDMPDRERIHRSAGVPDLERVPVPDDVPQIERIARGGGVPGTERVRNREPAGPTSGRARPLPPDERRDMLVVATIPLLAKHGLKVTSRQIAQAAGVAEGTIFRVFADKDELVRAAVGRCLDPTPVLAELRRVDVGLPLHERMVEVITILQRRLIEIFNLLIALRMHGPPEKATSPSAARPANDAILDAVVRLFESDRTEFRCPVSEVARMLRLVTFSGSHPLIAEGRLLTPDEIVSLVLDGVRRHPEASNRTNKRGDSPC